MTLTANDYAAIINWIPAGGAEAGAWGKQYNRGAAGVAGLYVIRRKVNGRTRYGLCWATDTMVASLDWATQRRGACVGWPFDNETIEAATWFRSKAAAFDAAQAA